MTDQYVPDEDEMRHAYWLTRLLDHHADVDAAFDRFLARVRRDAKAEALRDAVENVDVGSLADAWTHGAITRLSVTNAAAEVRKAKVEAILMDGFDMAVADRLADAGYTEYAEDEDGGVTWVSAPLGEVLHIVRACAAGYETGGRA